MELWKLLLSVLKEESVYAPILSIIGASLIVLKEKEEHKNKTTLMLFVTFFIGIMLSLTLVPFITDVIQDNVIKSVSKYIVKLRPFGYFSMGFFGDRIFDWVQSFVAFLSSKEVRKKLFNSIINWFLESLTKMKSDD